ncbi:hypothetical protein COW95_00480 [Candidatus Peregrinibacteria bacterium CG22_combo_CG10-13_8_21_14_all_49_11]|nr:MAG: hypothetical protein COW95_00480 [Candidatus Peregrinibacteria bacterium CG22_combo_CG10-13_8_21_14_all_49_11]
MNTTEKLLTGLVNIGERQFSGEKDATELLKNSLQREGVPVYVQEFPLKLPQEKSAVLLLDGKQQECRATSFVSGSIDNKECIISSALPMAESPDLPNINFNPYCRAISRGNHYWNPAVAVSHDVLQRILTASSVRAKIDIECVEDTAHNLLVGNTDDPNCIVFTHYDSIGPGAFDNASGTVACVDAVVQRRHTLDTTLFVLSGAEELSTKKPYYWGEGYRQFQREYAAQMKHAQQILVVDSVGAGPLQWIQDPRVLRRAFPINDAEALLPKIQLLCTDLLSLMPVYHSELDTVNCVELRKIAEASEKLLLLL